MSYLGSYSDRLWSTMAINQGIYMGLGPCTIQGVAYPVCSTNANLNVRRVLYQENPREAQFLGAMDENLAIGWQTYHGMKLSAQRRSATGLSFNANYTLSRCVGTDTPSTFNQINAGYVKPGDPEYDKGYCSQDHRHLAAVTLGAESPDRNGLLGVLASHWRASGIVSIRDGNRINIITGQDNAFTGVRNQRPNQVNDDLYASPRTLNNYFNSAAFAAPAAGTYGNLPRNTVLGPNYWNVDLALSRTLPVVAAHTLELRLEAFNLFNTFNWGDPADPAAAGGAIATLNSSQFGRILTQAGSARIIQLGMKYSF